MKLWEKNNYDLFNCSPLSDGTGTGASKSERPVDSSEVVRDGKVHFKIRMGENKVC